MANVTNEKVKRTYLSWLRDARGLSEMTIVAVERAIGQYEDYSHYEALGKFNQTRAVGFKDWLKDRKVNGNRISATTVYHTLRHVKDFFAWLSTQPGYRTKINSDHVTYLCLDKKTNAMVTAPKHVKSPSLEYVIKLCASIRVSDDVTFRDRALISCLLLSGARDKALATLPLACFDRKNLVIHQDPARNVATKFSRAFSTTLLPFDEQLVQFLIEWSNHLEHDLLFSGSDPLFPRTKPSIARDSGITSSGEVEPIFWRTTGPIREILRKRAEATGLEYYKPHAFRHAAAKLARESCRTMHEFKAVSLNLGHRRLDTTMMTYGALDDSEIHDVVSNLQFGKQEGDCGIAEIDRAIDVLNRLKRRGDSDRD